MITIYLYQNNINYKIYIGQTVNFNKRIYEHLKNSKTNYCHPFYNAIRKYGIENFSIIKLEQFDNYEDADESEIFYISFFRSWDREFGYNIELGGRKNKIVSNETKIKLSNIHKGKCYNSKEHMDKIHKISAEKRKGKPLPDSTRKKLSIKRTGFKHSQYSKNKMSKTRIERKTFAGENNPGYRKFGDLNPAAKLTWKIVENIRIDYQNGIKGKKLIEKYNLSETNMYRIIKNITWVKDK